MICLLGVALALKARRRDKQPVSLAKLGPELRTELKAVLGKWEGRKAGVELPVGATDTLALICLHSYSRFLGRYQCCTDVEAALERGTWAECTRSQVGLGCTPTGLSPASQTLSALRVSPHDISPLKNKQKCSWASADLRGCFKNLFLYFWSGTKS